MKNSTKTMITVIATSVIITTYFPNLTSQAVEVPVTPAVNTVEVNNGVNVNMEFNINNEQFPSNSEEKSQNTFVDEVKHQTTVFGILSSFLAAIYFLPKKLIKSLKGH